MYNFFIALSIVLGMGIAAYEMWRKKVPNLIIVLSEILTIALVLYFGFIVTYFSSRFENVGLNSTGGALGIIFGVIIFALITPQYKDAFTTSYFIVLPLCYGIGKIGCAFEGCCGGLPYNGILHVTTEKGNFFPIQALEAVTFLGIFTISMYAEKRGYFKPVVAAMIYSAIKILLDFLRYSHVNEFISKNQMMCASIIVALFGFTIARKRLF